MFKIASWVHTFEKCASQFARKSILPTDISILSGSEWPKKMALDHFNLASFTKYSSAHWFYWTDWKESTMSFEEGEKNALFRIPYSPFSPFQFVSILKNVFQFPRSLSSISQIQPLLHCRIMSCWRSTTVFLHNVNQFTFLSPLQIVLNNALWVHSCLKGNDLLQRAKSLRRSVRLCSVK